MESTEHTIRIHRLATPVTVLGPFSRACIWVQGCSINCPDCITPEAKSPNGGTAMSITKLARWVLSQSEIEGITLSGGEPFDQAQSLNELILNVRSKRNLGIVCYTGYTLDELRDRSDENVNCLLASVDLLIDGSYISDFHRNLLWRASTNQRLINLTERYKLVIESIVNEKGDTSNGLEIITDEDGALVVTGVPQDAGFRTKLLNDFRRS